MKKLYCVIYGFWVSLSLPDRLLFTVLTVWFLVCVYLTTR